MMHINISKGTWAWGAAGVAAIAALAWAFAPRPVQVEVAPVTQGRFEQAIEEDGQTRVRDRYTISAPVAARLARITLREGDSVAAGDIVAVLTPVMAPMIDERSAREAAARMRGASAGVERAGARVERAKVAMEEAALELQRVQRLAGDGFVAPSRLDAARLAQAAAQRELEGALAEREVAVQERAQAAAVRQPAAAAGTGMRLVAVRSPVTGVVLRVALQSEATIAAGAALLDVGDPAKMEVVAELLTTDAVQARPGTRTVIERWGGPAVEGRVRLVEPSAFTKVSALGIEEQRVKVLVDIVDPPSAWRSLGDGFRVSARVVVNGVDRALMVPVGAVFPDQGGSAVFVVQGSKAHRQRVEVAARNSSTAWIRTGLAAGQGVVIYPPATLADGKRVAVRSP